MTYLILILSFLTLQHFPLLGYHNEYHYEGNPEWEKYENRLDIVSKYIPENPTVFEVGAFDGSDSVRMARHWPHGKVISFEANPARFAEHQEKIKSCPNASSYNLAVNTYNGVAKFYVCWGSTGDDPIFEGASSLLEPSEAQKVHFKGPEITVPCVIFDDWCQNNGVKAIDFMWLDLEGFELQFLMSSPKILKTVRAIYSETNFFKFREGTTQFVYLKKYLELQGFSMIAHWYNEGVQGDAIFIRKEYINKKNS